MKPILTATILMIVLPTIAAAQAPQSCTDFQALVKATYITIETIRTRLNVLLDRAIPLRFAREKHEFKYPE